MKIAVSGKGGAGKTLVSGLLAWSFADDGYQVIAIDADPDANLATTLGFGPETGITPLSQLKELIKDRTSAGEGEAGYFKLNPHVGDIPEKYSVQRDGIRLLVMGQVKKGGAGCYCPENSLLGSLMAHLILGRDEVVIMDMAAGIEHLNRGTARRVDILLVVTEPSRASIETTKRIQELARDIGLDNLTVVGNKIRSQTEKDFLVSALPGFQFSGFIPYDQAITNAEVHNGSLKSASPSINQAVKDIYRKLTGPQARGV